MTNDFDRSVNATPGSELYLGDVYRVNPADRDRGKSGQDRFREALNRRRQQQDDDENNEHPPGDQPLADRVMLSPATKKEPQPTPDNPPPDAPPEHINIKA